jgi:hypothetical protein
MDLVECGLDEAARKTQDIAKQLERAILETNEFSSYEAESKEKFEGGGTSTRNVVQDSGGKRVKRLKRVLSRIQGLALREDQFQMYDRIPD